MKRGCLVRRRLATLASAPLVTTMNRDLARVSMRVFLPAMPQRWRLLPRARLPVTPCHTGAALGLFFRIAAFTVITTGMSKIAFLCHEPSSE